MVKIRPYIPPLLWLFLTWAFILIFPRPFDDAKEIIFYTMAGISFALVAKKYTQFISSPPLVVLIAVAYLMICGLSFGQAFYEGILETVRIALWCGFVYALTFFDWRKTAIASVISACLIIILNVLSIPWILGGPWEWNKYVLPPIGHSSYYGVFMALHVPLCIHFFHNQKRFWIVPLGLLFVGIFLSSSRAAILGVSAGVGLPILVAYLTGNDKRGRELILAGLIVPVIVLGILFFSGNASERQLLKPLISKMLSRKNSGDLVSPGRAHTWRATFEMVKDKPVAGHGIGSYRFAYPAYGRDKGLAMSWVYHPHNELLNQAAEVGIVGLLIWLLGIVTLYLVGLSGLLSYLSTNRKEEIALGLCGLTVLVVAWQFDTSYLNPLIRCLAAFYASLIIRREA